jgi:hypothetical protein
MKSWMVYRACVVNIQWGVQGVGGEGRMKSCMVYRECVVSICLLVVGVQCSVAVPARCK